MHGKCILNSFTYVTYMVNKKGGGKGGLLLVLHTCRNDNNIGSTVTI